MTDFQKGDRVVWVAPMTGEPYLGKVKRVRGPFDRYVTVDFNELGEELRRSETLTKLTEDD